MLLFVKPRLAQPNTPLALRQSWTGSLDSTGEKVIDLMGSRLCQMQMHKELILHRLSYLNGGALWVSWISYSAGLPRVGFYINYECCRVNDLM